MNELHYRQAEERLFADAGVAPREHTVTLRCVGTRARVLEVGSGTPALFLHGGPIAAATFAYVAANVKGVRCLLLDRPGTGLSEAPPFVPAPETIDDYVARLSVDVLDALGLRRAAVVGSSFGGFSALRTAERFPDRVTSVVVAGCPAFVPGWRRPAFFAWLRNPVLRAMLVRGPATMAGARMSLKQLGHAEALRDGRIPMPMVEWTKAWQGDTDTMRNDVAMIRKCAFDPSVDLDADDLARVVAPCLLLAGTADPVGDDATMKRLAAMLPNAELDVWVGAGHLPWLDDPSRAAAQISGFVR